MMAHLSHVARVDATPQFPQQRHVHCAVLVDGAPAQTAQPTYHDHHHSIHSSDMHVKIGVSYHLVLLTYLHIYLPTYLFTIVQWSRNCTITLLYVENSTSLLVCGGGLV